LLDDIALDVLGSGLGKDAYELPHTFLSPADRFSSEDTYYFEFQPCFLLYGEITLCYFSEEVSNLVELAKLVRNLGKDSQPSGFQSLATIAYDQALPLLESAINAHNEEFGEGHPGSIYTLINYCSALFRSGQHEAALERYLKTKELVLKTVGTDHDKYFKVMQHLSGIYTELERYQEAEACLRENLELQISRKDDSTFEVAVLLRGLAGVLNRTGDPAEAEECARRAVDIFRIVAAEESFQAIVARKVFAHVLFNRGKYAEALAELLDLIELTQKIGSDPFELMIFYQNVVVEIYSRQERWEDAEKFLANILSSYREKGTESPAYAEYQTKYAEVLKKLGKLT